MIGPSVPEVIPTINDDAEVDNFSEKSDEEVEFQPSKHKNKLSNFDADFQFVSSVDEYNNDAWNDLTKYVKRKAKSKTDDKIRKQRLKNETEIKNEFEVQNNSEDILSDDELVHDHIKVKEKKTKKAKIKNDEDFFQEGSVNTESSNFYQMNLSRPLLKAVTDMKFVHPTPIQASAIPIALLGRDICACAATGTGKTAAYMLPTLERLLYRPSGGPATTRVLVLVPTRELGVQVYQVSKQLAQFTNVDIGLAVGGLDLKSQEVVLRKKPDIVIATPGRLIDHLKSTPTFSLDSIEVLVLDEADRMLDEYFAEQMKEIIKQCSRTKQTLLFSATMTDEVENLASLSLKKPVRLFVDNNRQVAFNLRQEFIRIRSGKEDDREAILAALVCRTFRTNCMVFVQMKKQAHRLHILLGLLGLNVAELHGNLTQPQRLEALNKFKNGEADILIATDVAARGLDIIGVQTVINFVMPMTVEHYIHRVGRTARAGRAGVSVSLADESERKIIKEIVKKAKNSVKSRIIPLDILNKYKERIKNLEVQIEDILKEEEEERLLHKAENQANKIEKALKGETENKRKWFQTKKEREQEKQKLSNLKTFKTKKNGKVDKKKKKLGNEKEINEASKLALVQAKQIKRKNKLKKLSTVNDDNSGNSRKLPKKRKANFADYTDTSRKSVKKLRYTTKFK